MKRFFVTWEAEVMAENAEDAAGLAASKLWQTLDLAVREVLPDGLGLPKIFEIKVTSAKTFLSGDTSWM